MVRSEWQWRRRPTLCLALVLLVVSSLARCEADKLELGHGRSLRQAKHTTQYLDNDSLMKAFQSLAEKCAGIAEVIEWGRSVKGAPLYAFEIYGGRWAGKLRPSFKYVGNIHGDEPSGRQLLLQLADHLCERLIANDEQLTSFVSDVALVIIPTANPDGFELKTRNNANNKDLNRNYPDPQKITPSMDAWDDLKKATGMEEPETLAMMQLTLSRNYIGSLALHEGAMVANYPWDGFANLSKKSTNVKHGTPDDETFKYLAKTYASLHTTMAKGNKDFKDGITNGAEWYPVYGGMQDWNYVAGGCLEITLEINNDKWPSTARLGEMWEENKEALVKYPQLLAYGGVWGKAHRAMSDGRDIPVLSHLHVEGQGYNVTSTATGMFFRPLAPGKHKLVFTAAGSDRHSFEAEVPADGSGVKLNVRVPRRGHEPEDGRPLISVVPRDAPFGDGGQAAPIHVGRGADVGSAAGDSEWLMPALLLVGVPVLVVGVLLAIRNTKYAPKQLDPVYEMVGLPTERKRLC